MMFIKLPSLVWSNLVHYFIYWTGRVLVIQNTECTFRIPQSYFLYLLCFWNTVLKCFLIWGFLYIIAVGTF
jgi:hypothetical protein